VEKHALACTARTFSEKTRKTQKKMQEAGVALEGSRKSCAKYMSKAMLRNRKYFMGPGEAEIIKKA
jgi:hypothetical protein